MAPAIWRVGENVPWSVSWTGEQRYALVPSRDFPGRADLTQVENPGQGTPKFANLHVTRCHNGMRDNLCHVCGRRTLARDRYMFPLQAGNLVIIGDGSQRFASNIPPVHLACARRAAIQCPHLSQAQAEPVPYPAEPSVLVPRPDIPEGMEAIASQLPRGAAVVWGVLRVHGPRFSRKLLTLRPP